MPVPYCEQPETKRLDLFFLPHLPVVCNSRRYPIGNTPVFHVRQIHCDRCGTGFFVCQSCWRGQRYCSEECREPAQREARQGAQRRYRRTEKGKKTHREAEKRRRVGLAKKNERIVGDGGSSPQCGCTTLLTSPGGDDERRQEWHANASRPMGRCQFCGAWGIIVARFPRRGYGKKRVLVARPCGEPRTQGRDDSWVKKK